MKSVNLAKLYELAGKRGVALEVEWTSLARLEEANFELRVFLENSVFKSEDKLALVAKLMPKASALFRDLIGLLLKEGLEKDFIHLAEQYSKLVAVKTGTLFVDVQSAFPLSDEERELVSRWAGAKTSLREEIKPELIGSISVRTGDGRHFDGSLLGAINKMKEQIINA